MAVVSSCDWSLSCSCPSSMVIISLYIFAERGRKDHEEESDGILLEEVLSERGENEADGP